MKSPFDSVPIPEHLPVIVGVGEHSLRAFDPSIPCAPVDLAAKAAQRAAADTGRATEVLADIDTVAFIRLFVDMGGWSPQPFGKSAKPPRSLCQRLGITPPHALYSRIGGNAPQMLLNEYAEKIVRGECRTLLLAGGEAQRSSDEAEKQGIRLDWNEDPPGTCTVQGDDDEQISALISMTEIAHGLDLPAASYALFENALRARRGATVAAHRASMARLMARLAALACHNPHAAFGHHHSAAELAAVTADNRWIAHPFTRRMVADNRVDQAAAVIMTSVGNARRLGIPEDQWIYLRGCGDANDRLRAIDHVHYDAAPAIGVAAHRALTMAGLEIDELDFFDLYSCFPVAVELACAALGLAEDDPRDLSVTGGLPYFGGPLNAYSLHAIAQTVARLRRTGLAGERHALVTANGGLLSKQSVGVYSIVPAPHDWQRTDPAIDQARLDEETPPRIEDAPQGAARIETYTVLCQRGEPVRGVIVGRLLENNARFLANTPADRPDILAWLMTADPEPVGSTGQVTSDGGLNTFTPQAFR
jgi:acetyl-CoA C-acetyltransferase